MEGKSLDCRSKLRGEGLKEESISHGESNLRTMRLSHHTRGDYTAVRKNDLDL